MISLSFQSLAGNPLINFVGWILVHSLWQAALIAASAAVLLTNLRRRSAQLRYVVACAALVAIVGMPVLTSISFSYLGIAPISIPQTGDATPNSFDSTPPLIRLTKLSQASDDEIAATRHPTQDAPPAIQPGWTISLENGIEFRQRQPSLRFS